MDLITVSQAKKIIEENVSALPVVKVALQDAAGMILAEDVFSQTDIPPFNQSSVDGYAFLFNNWQHKQLVIEGEIPAGHNTSTNFSNENAIRIFTGAPVPDGADTVVMQEKTSAQNNLLHIDDEKLEAGNNVRLKGTDIKKGELALAKQTLLSPAAIGFLAGVGIDAVNVFKKPTVSIIVTGNELQQPGVPLTGGQVYESNSYMLTAALQQLNLTASVLYCKDELERLKETLNRALETSDVVLLTGGVSVGDYDFVPEAATACGVNKLFHKIKQRPGKPLFFGKREDKLVFGLPGNPSSVLTCFYEYVIPALHLLNTSIKSLQTIYVPLAKPFQKQVLLTHFIKAIYDGKNVTPLGAQESYRLSSFAKANCLMVVKEETMFCAEGEIMEVHLLPF